MKGKGPISKMMGHVVNGNPMDAEEMGETAPDNETNEMDPQIHGLSVDRNDQGYTVNIRKPTASSTHHFPHGHPVMQHIRGILKHAGYKK